MTPQPPLVISASRRTDIPGCYTSWFMDCISRGFFHVYQPFTGNYRQIDVTPENTHSIVFWSKNYGPFLSCRADQILMKKGFSLYFHFTINSESPLEPGIPDLSRRLRQLEILVDTHGPDKIAWRFDPVIFYQVNQQKGKDNLEQFQRIADHAGRLGISRCITSFYTPHEKIKNRQKFLQSRKNFSFRFTVPDMTKMIKTVKEMAAYLKPYNMLLALCAEQDLFKILYPEPTLFSSPLPEDLPDNILENACIDGNLLQKLYRGAPRLDRDRGQRTELGCRCTHSVDIGSYKDHPCAHNCLFCYGRTRLDTRIQKHTRETAVRHPCQERNAI